MFTIIDVNKESRRITAEDAEDKTCVTVTVHRDNKEGTDFLTLQKVGTPLEIQFGPTQESEKDVLLKETNEKLQKEIEELKAQMSKTTEGKDAELQKMADENAKGTGTV